MAAPCPGAPATLVGSALRDLGDHAARVWPPIDPAAPVRPAPGDGWRGWLPASARHELRDGPRRRRPGGVVPSRGVRRLTGDPLPARRRILGRVDRQPPGPGL